MPTTTTAAPRQLSDGNSQGTILGQALNSNGLPDQIGFYGVATTVAKQTVTGSKGANAALTSLMAALVAMGLVTDTTS